MLGAARALRWALVGLHDEILLLLRANLIWFCSVLPVGAALFLLLATLAALPETALLWPLLGTALLLLIVPGPASLALCRLAAAMAGRDSPPFGLFLSGLRGDLRLGLVTLAVGLAGVGLLGLNVWFYWSVLSGPPRLLSIAWLYLLGFWLGLQLYLGPLVALLGERRLRSLYRRAALLALANAGPTVALLLAAGLVTLASMFVVPLYLLLGAAFLALASTRVVHDLRQRYDWRPGGGKSGPDDGPWTMDDGSPSSIVHGPSSDRSPIR